jgi:DNA-directed RNA polymerase subunit RPC12/RpoP
MQINWLIILLIAAAVIVALVIIFSRIFKIKPQCPYCQSKDIVETSRETVATRTVETMGGGSFAGSVIRVQVELKVAYHCHHCGQRFSRRIMETH